MSVVHFHPGSLFLSLCWLYILFDSLLLAPISSCMYPVAALIECVNAIGGCARFTIQNRFPPHKKKTNKLTNSPSSNTITVYSISWHQLKPELHELSFMFLAFRYNKFIVSPSVLNRNIKISVCQLFNILWFYMVNGHSSQAHKSQ